MKLPISLLALATSSAIAFDTVINVPPDVVPNGTTLADNTQLNVLTGGVTGLFLSTGTIDPVTFDFLPAENVEINVLGGTVADAASFFGDVTINLESGTMAGFDADNGVTVHMSGGVIGTENICSISGYGEPSVFNLSGGSLGDFFDVNPGATLNVSGGSFGARLEIFGNTPEFDFGGTAQHPGTVNFIGSGFAIDGVPIDGLVADTPFTVTEREGQLLTGTLADGEPFEFHLNATGSTSLEDVLYTNAILTVTLAQANPPAEPPRLEILSVEPISPTQRQVMMQLTATGNPDLTLYQSTDLGITDPWTPVHDAVFITPPGQPDVREVSVTPLLTTPRLFFRVEIRNE
jgi:hypothetical protein